LTVSPTQLAWHANEERTRSFLVLKSSLPEEDPRALNKLLGASNAVAASFGCAQLYSGRRGRETIGERGSSGGVVDAQTGDEGVATGPGREGDASDAFHISLAWSLNDEETLSEADLQADRKIVDLMARLRSMRIAFTEVKIRLGKDVSSVGLARTRRVEGGILGR